MMSTFAHAQNASVSGTVITDDGAAIGAVAKLQGTTRGAITDLDGTFTIASVIPGAYNLVISSVGYEDLVSSISLGPGETLDLGTLSLSGGSLAIQGIEVIADIAIDRKTPVAVSNIDGETIQNKTGNQELTMMLTSTPSVYASQGSGGFGDSRLSVRGFDDQNVVVMVNGVPVNDMENQALFWSNWTGLQDVASKIQIQRGLGATLLAVPSVGGTVNIISKATDREKGGWASTSIGNDLYRKYAVNLSTGNMNGWAITASGSRTTGNGYVDGNFIDAYSWFGSVTRDWDNHSLVLTGFGSPQRHGQGFNRTLSTFVAPEDGDYEQYIKSSKAHDFDGRAQELGDNGSANSIRYNSGWGYTDFDVNTGFTNGGVFNQFSNFYHKPQISLSHLWDVNDGLEITSALYGSWGRGGGASDWRNFSNSGGHRWFNYQQNGGPVDWDALRANNIALNPDGIARQGSDNNPFYFYRASMNHHNYYGLLSKGIIELDETLDLTVGVDARTYFADHVRKVIDMFGLTGYQHSDFGTQQVAVPTTANFGYDDENLFNRNNTGFVNWMGAFSELEYSTDNFTAAAGGSISNKGYKKEQFIEGSAGESDWFNFLGGAGKLGARYNLSSAFDIFGNVGYLSIQPIFDNVFQGGNNGGVSEDFINEDAPNEKVFNVELGAGVRTPNFAANLNVYRTNWQDKAYSIFSPDGGNMGEPVFGNVFGIDALHQGVELDFIFQPGLEGLSINGAGSIGDWTWENNTDFVIFDQSGGNFAEGTVFLEDVKVGDAPQSQMSLGADYNSTFGLGLYTQYRQFFDHYAEFDPIDRQDETLVGLNSQKLPNYGLLDAGVNYTFPISNKNMVRFDLNMNNLLDELYVTEAQGGIEGQTLLQDIRGNFGLGRTWNAGVRLEFRDSGEPASMPNVPMPAPADMDADNDGVIDSRDDCPNVPGTVQGCPDSDGDGVIDADDDCPSVAGLASDMGCPVEMEEPQVIVEEKVIEVEVDNDRDGDGVVDDRDNCPDTAGNIANIGCPGEPEKETVVITTPAPAPTIEVIERLNFVARSVLFNTASAELRTESRVSLDEIARTVMQYPDADFVIEGHTDNTGGTQLNQDLSQRRAQSVVNYLVGKGVNRSKLSAIGYGETRPIASNDTSEGRQQNRRVVIKVK